jgi:hypothetical protein
LGTLGDKRAIEPLSALYEQYHVQFDGQFGMADKPQGQRGIGPRDRAKEEERLQRMVFAAAHRALDRLWLGHGRGRNSSDQIPFPGM